MEIFDQTVSFSDHKIAFKFIVKRNVCCYCRESYESYIWKRFLANIKILEGYYAIFERKVYSEVDQL